MKFITLFSLLLLCGCSSFKNGSPPTSLEQHVFTVQTNQVPVVTPDGVTNFKPVYTYSPGPVVKDVQTGLGLIPGYGGLAGTAVGVIAALWGWVRSSKNYKTGANLAQSIETIREFVKQLPNGATYDSALTTWLQQHQADTGTVSDVLNLLSNDVSNPDAQIAAQQIREAIMALNPSALPKSSPGK